MSRETLFNIGAIVLILLVLFFFKDAIEVYLGYR